VTLVGRSAKRFAGETPIGRKRRARKMAKVLAETHPDAHCELDFTTPLELAVATILSAQTTDVRVNQVTPRLFRKFQSAADYASAARLAIVTGRPVSRARVAAIATSSARTPSSTVIGGVRPCSTFWAKSSSCVV